MLIEWFYTRRWSAVSLCSGIITGLIGITPAASVSFSSLFSEADFCFKWIRRISFRHGHRNHYCRLCQLFDETQAHFQVRSLCLDFRFFPLTLPSQIRRRSRRLLDSRCRRNCRLAPHGNFCRFSSRWIRRHHRHSGRMDQSELHPARLPTRQHRLHRLVLVRRHQRDSLRHEPYPWIASARDGGGGDSRYR